MRKPRGRWQLPAPSVLFGVCVLLPTLATAEEPQPEDHENQQGPQRKVTPPPRGFATDERGEPLVALHFRSPQPELRLYLGPVMRPIAPQVGAETQRLDPSEFREVCPAPCARWVYPGEYSLGAGLAPDPGKEPRRPVRANESLWIEDPSLVSAEYHSYGWFRMLGWATMGAGLVGGSLFVLYAFDRCDGEGECLQDTPWSWIGAGTFFAGVTGGLLLTLKDDEVSFSVTPAVGLPDPD